MSETTTDAPVSLSEGAAREIKSIIKQQELDVEKVRLRIGVKGGGCSGFSYILDLTESQKEHDEAFEPDQAGADLRPAADALEPLLTDISGFADARAGLGGSTPGPPRSSLWSVHRSPSPVSVSICLFVSIKVDTLRTNPTDNR